MIRKIITTFMGLILAAIFITAPEALGQLRQTGLRRYPANPRLAASNGRQSLTGKVSPAKDLRGLIKELRAGGLKVKSAGTISQPFFSVKGRLLTINGEQVQVFEYANTGRAEREAKRVDPDGSGAGTSKAMWIAPPHFYKSGRLIVLYLGNNPALIKTLEKTLGPQFAGQ